MGREATIRCEWAGESGQCKVLLESKELIVRGAIRRKVPVSSLQDVTVKGDDLHFKAGADSVSLALGSALAQQWAKAIATPAPSLARKLGISSNSRLLLIGDLESPDLNAAIDEASSTTGKDADLVLVSVQTPHDLELALAQLARRKSEPLPMWIIYPKGTINNFGETYVRETLRARGFIDTKIASVSSKLTALRFIRRRD